MNKVFVSGIVMATPVLHMEPGEIPHILFEMDIAHKTRAGKLHHEHYSVNAWHNTARWGAANLKQGMHIAVQGYLTQRILKVGDSAITLTEITADEFLLCQLPLRKDAASVPTPASVILSSAEKTIIPAAIPEPIQADEAVIEDAVPDTAADGIAVEDRPVGTDVPAADHTEPCASGNSSEDDTPAEEEADEHTPAVELNCSI